MSQPPQPGQRLRHQPAHRATGTHRLAGQPPRDAAGATPPQLWQAARPDAQAVLSGQRAAVLLLRIGSPDDLHAYALRGAVFKTWVVGETLSIATTSACRPTCSSGATTTDSRSTSSSSTRHERRAACSRPHRRGRVATQTLCKNCGSLRKFLQISVGHPPMPLRSNAHRSSRLLRSMALSERLLAPPARMRTSTSRT